MSRLPRLGSVLVAAAASRAPAASPAIACDRFATLDPPTAHQGFGAYEEDGGEVGTGPVEDQGVTVLKRPGATLERRG